LPAPPTKGDEMDKIELVLLWEIVISFVCFILGLMFLGGLRFTKLIQ
jgi:hypothetical protein